MVLIGRTVPAYCVRIGERNEQRYFYSICYALYLNSSISNFTSSLILLEMKTIDELLTRGRAVTEANDKKNGEPCLNDQLLKIYEEVYELQQADNPLHALEEGCDVIYAVLTFFHNSRFDDYAIKQALESTMQKIERRANEKPK